MNNLIKDFKNPPSSHRPAPLWVWNDEMNKEEIHRQLKELAEHGFGGAFVHPRPGLISWYLDEEWFEMWRYALETSKKLGMKLYIYDENSYPSGFAGGLVSSALPDCLADSMTYKIIDNPADVGGELISAFAGCEKDGKLVISKDVSRIVLLSATFPKR